MPPCAKINVLVPGVGAVLSVSKNGGDIEYQVTFETAGTKRLLQTYARLVRA